MAKMKMKMHDSPGYARSKARDRLEKHYTEWFDTLGDETLYRIYDIENENFIASEGPQGSFTMNRFTLAKTIAYALVEDNEKGTEILQSWIAIVDKDELDFGNPVFIGSEDT